MVCRERKGSPCEMPGQREPLRRLKPEQPSDGIGQTNRGETFVLLSLLAKARGQRMKELIVDMTVIQE